MEDVIEVYHRPYDAARPQVCVDEGGKQLVGDVREPLPVRPGSAAKQDSEYARHGTANLFLAFEPLAGRRVVEVTDRRTAVDFARFLKRLLDEVYPAADRVVLVTDNLNTHGPGSLYEAFDPAEARRLAERLEWHDTPKHGSWLNMAEVELSVLARQCLDRRIPDRAAPAREVAAWAAGRKADMAGAAWRFATGDARIRLKKLYPTIEPQ
jgi:DDE superfamily endonuclease